MLLSIVVVIVTELLFELLKVTGKLAESRKPYLSFADDVLERDMYENLFSATGTKDNPFVDLEQVRQVVKINSKASGLKEEEPEVDLNQRLFVELKWKTMEANLDPVAMSVAELVGTRLPVGALQEEKKNTRQGRTKLVRTNVTWDVELTQNEMTRYKRMAQWSAAAYCSEQDILNWSCGPRCTGLTDNTRISLYFTSAITNTVGFIGNYVDMDNEEDVIVITFRGAVPFINWVENVKFAKEPSPWPDALHSGARIDSGFLDYYADIASTIRTVVMMLKRRFPEAMVVVTGHGLGGAVATLCAADLKYHLGQDAKVELVSFHAPRVGNQDFASFMNFIFKTSNTKPGERPYTRRFTNRDDPVILLPPTFLAFSHIAQEVWVNMNNQTQACDPTLYEDTNCSLSTLHPNDLSCHFYIWDTIFTTDCSV